MSPVERMVSIEMPPEPLPLEQPSPSGISSALGARSLLIILFIPSFRDYTKTWLAFVFHVNHLEIKIALLNFIMGDELCLASLNPENLFIDFSCR